MATLDLEASDVDSEYSDGFLEDLSYSQSSSGDESNNELVARLQSSLAQNHNSDTVSINTSSSRSKPNLGRTIRTPKKSTQVGSRESITEFNSSQDIREACYSEWLCHKRLSISLDQCSKQKVVEEEQAKKKSKESEKTERGTKALDRWNTAKEKHLEAKSKEKQKLARQKKLEEEERRQKLMAMQTVSEKWREEKTKDLLKKQRETRRKEKEEMKKKSEAMTEKDEETAAAYNAWKQKKDGLTKEQQKKQYKEKRTLQNQDKQNKVERIDDSKKAFEAWKSKKDDVLKMTGTMFTYKRQSKIHAKPWCPARATKPDYPKDPATLTHKKTKQLLSSRSNSASTKSYESESFESATSSSEHSFVDTENEGSVELAPVRVTGKRKTIQVCCQTLEYWCTCQQ